MRDVLLVLITATSAVGASLGAQYLAGRHANVRADRESTASRQQVVREIIVRLLTAAAVVEAHTQGGIYTNSSVTVPTDALRALGSAQVEVTLVVADDLLGPIETYVSAVLMRSNFWRSGATEKMRSQALDAVREHQIADSEQLDALQRACIKAARSAIAAACVGDQRKSRSVINESRVGRVGVLPGSGG